MVRAEFGEDNEVIINHGILELELSDYHDPWALFYLFLFIYLFF